MAIPEAALLLAGFVLAHSAWSVSDLQRGEFLTPLAIVESGGERRVLRFEADTQEEAIALARAHLSSLTVETWAFAHEGLMPYDGSKVDVIAIDLWASGMDKPVTLVQRFIRRATEGTFCLVGQPILSVGGVLLAEASVQTVVELILEGVHGHPEVAELWNSWTRKPFES